MSRNTKIEWADHTFNAWVGCTKISPACDHCYAEGWAKRSGKAAGVVWGGERRRTSESNWQQPIKWNAEAERLGIRYRVFCASLADVFDNAVPTTWRVDLFRLIEKTPNLSWLLLTKRIGNAANMMFTARGGHLPLLQNVWIGATICNQAEADRDIPKLLAVPAAKRFLSIEPLLGPVDLLTDSLMCNPCPWCADQRPDPGTGTVENCKQCEWTGKSSEPGIDWVIVGGESGPGARPMHPDWVRSLRDQCVTAGVSFLFKQWGEWVDADNGPDDDSVYEGKAECWVHIEGGHHSGEMGVDFFNTYPMYRIGKKAAGRMLDGREWHEVPA